MFVIRKFYPIDADEIARHANSPYIAAEQCALSVQAFTIEHDGVPVVSFGAFEDLMRQGVYMVWMITGEKSGPAMLRLTRFALKWLKSLNARRLECYVMADFKAAVRWMKMLGFTNETPNGMINFDGTDRVWFQYARAS